MTQQHGKPSDAAAPLWGWRSGTSALGSKSPEAHATAVPPRASVSPDVQVTRGALLLQGCSVHVVDCAVTAEPDGRSPHSQPRCSIPALVGATVRQLVPTLKVIESRADRRIRR